MTIRTRLTFWYAGIMFVSLLAMGLLSYYEFVDEPRNLGLHDAKVAKEVIVEDDTEDFTQALKVLFWCGVPPMLLALGGGWWLMRKSLKPVAALTAAVERISEHHLNEQLPKGGTGDELDRLTEVFNAMTVRLDSSFTRIRDFTLHASHELKTPLTILCGETEMALREENLSPTDRERAMSQLDELRRLARIVDGLTLLAKADAGQIILQIESISLAELVRDNFADMQILAEPQNLAVQLETCEEITVRGDRHRLRQLLLNLADNAVKYNQPQGRVSINLRRIDGFAELTIANTGTGIPAELLPRIFDRFFRGDPAHGNAVDGCGLGLSIVQWIVTAHDGMIQISSNPALTLATVKLPVA
ncbi:MAG TPA: ATP-binding protein [Verrucomicrobiae bacterium]|jgi:heavy metal sensor kinase